MGALAKGINGRRLRYQLSKTATYNPPQQHTRPWPGDTPSPGTGAWRRISVPARPLQALPKRPVWNALFNGVSTAREGQGEGEMRTLATPQLGAAAGPPCGAKQDQAVAP